jgi:hypothetical protein
MSRSAQSSYKGYTYQRARLLNLIFCKYYTPNQHQLNYVSFYEEHLEDIDISITDMNGNKEIHLYQEKCLSSDNEESLNKDSGLTKVIISHFNNEDITKINYEVLSISGGIKCTNKLNNFIALIKDNTNNHLIGKFIVLNYCYPKLFSNKTYNNTIQYIKQYNYEDITNLINETLKYEKENTNEYNLNQFCHYCNNSENINNLLIYVKKINVQIIDKTFNDIHNETINKIKNILPEFNEMYNRMSNQYNSFYSEALYGLFEMTIVNNLFQTNDKMTIKQLIDIIKDKITNSTTDTDKLMIITYTIQYFIRENKYDNIKNKLFDNNCLIHFMLKNKITITNFIRIFDKEKIVINNNIHDLIRTIIYKMCTLTNYDLVRDEQLLGFLYRSHKKIKFNGFQYKSLENFEISIYTKST